MSSNSSNRTAAQRERDRRAAAKAKRQASAASAAEAPATAPVVEKVDQAVVVERKATPSPARKDVKAPIVADADAVAIPLGDEHGEVATWMMLGVVFLLALLVVAIASAS
ncbi:MAG: hypothetical protein QM753_09935 [Thermomicrobiales bacterium]